MHLPRPLLAALLLLAGPLAAQPGLEAFLDGVIRQRMERGRVPGAVVAVVQEGKVLLLKGYGPVDPERTVFLAGSVAKPVTATAVMQLAERGRLRLDKPVKSWPFTPAQLLTHTAGFDVTLIGTAAPDPSGVLPLKALRMPPLVRPPGQVLAYSNHGYTLLGRLVEEASGQPFGRYMEENVFRPLGMRRSTFSVPPDAAAGYENGRPAPPVHPHIVPAAGLATTASDMARFLLAHLEGERRGGILSADAFRAMHRQRFTQDPRMPGMAYGFFESFENGQRALFHGGGIRGFMSGIYLWPEHRLGLFVADNGYDGDLVRAVAHGLLERAFPYEPRRPTPILGSVERARRCAGVYRLATWSRTTLEKASALRERGFVVRDLGGGALGIWGLRFVEVEPWLFQDAEGEERVAFRDGRMVTEELFVGNQVWERVPWTSSGALHRDAILLMLGIFLAALFLRPAEAPALFAASESPREARRAVRLGVLLGGQNVLFLALFAIGFRLAARGAGLLYGVPPLVTAALVLPLLGIPLAAAVAARAALAWKQGWWTLRWRLFYSALALAGLGFPAFLWFWNLLGFRY